MTRRRREERAGCPRATPAESARPPPRNATGEARASARAPAAGSKLTARGAPLPRGPARRQRQALLRGPLRRLLHGLLLPADGGGLPGRLHRGVGLGHRPGDALRGGRDRPGAAPALDPPGGVAAGHRTTTTQQRRELHGEHSRHLEELSASIAHEIRNPITAAKSLVQQMGEDPRAADNVEYAAGGARGARPRGALDLPPAALRTRRRRGDAHHVDRRRGGLGARDLPRPRRAARHQDHPRRRRRRRDGGRPGEAAPGRHQPLRQRAGRPGRVRNALAQHWRSRPARTWPATPSGCGSRTTGPASSPSA